MTKYKATGCGRFILVLIILAPLAYLGASYYLGQDGIGNIKNLLGIGTPTETMVDESTQPVSEDTKQLESENDALGDQIDEQAKEIKDLKEENTNLKERIQELEKELDELKSKEDVNQ